MLSAVSSTQDDFSNVNHGLKPMAVETYSIQERICWVSQIR